MEQNNSILTSVKKVCGLPEDYTAFDTDFIMHINTVLSILTQMGVGPITGFSISDSSSIWTDFVPEDTNFEAVKTLVSLRVRLIFDPPLNSSVLQAMQNTVKELEWRVYTNAEHRSMEGGTNGES